MGSFKLTEYLLGGGDGARGPIGTSTGLLQQGGLGRSCWLSWSPPCCAWGWGKSLRQFRICAWHTWHRLGDRHLITGETTRECLAWDQRQRQAQACLTPQAWLSPSGSIASPRMVVEGTSGRRGWDSTVWCRDWLQGIPGGWRCWMPGLPSCPLGSQSHSSLTGRVDAVSQRLKRVCGLYHLPLI